MSPLRLLASLVGAFVAAVGVCVALSVAYTLLAAAGRGAASAEVGSGLLFVAVNAAIVSAQIALLAIALLALPHVYVSQRLQRTSKRYFVLSGIAIGVITVVAAEIWQRRFPGPPFDMGSDRYFVMVSAIAAGAISALVYRRIAYPG
jgi:hypothetical protein